MGKEKKLNAFMLHHLSQKTHIKIKLHFCFYIVVVQLLAHVLLFATPWTAASLSFTISRSLLKFTSSQAVMLFNHLILCFPLLLLPSILPSIIEDM